MKLRGMLQNCTQLAATLSANYFSSEPFVPPALTTVSSSLNDYLSSHGVLLTMCMDNFCQLTNEIAWDHVSASWITNETGWSVIPGAQIGYILNPARVQIQCVYPTDGITAGRTQHGCGPTLQDTDYGPFGYQKSGRLYRRKVKRALERLLELNFGSKTYDASQLSCDFVLNRQRMMPPGPPTPVWTRTNGTIHTWPSYLSVVVDQYSAFLGRPLCNINVTLSSQNRRPKQQHLVDDYYHRFDDDRYRHDDRYHDDRYHPDDDNGHQDDDQYADMDDRYVIVDDRIDDLPSRQWPNRRTKHGLTPFSVGRSLTSQASGSPDEKGHSWWYVGPTSWKPNEWSSAMQLMIDSFLYDPTTHQTNTVWNEVVITTPVTLRSIVSAVFYTESSDETKDMRRLAIQQAQLLGNVPVLVVSQDPDTPLFECAAPVDSRVNDHRTVQA